MSSNDEIFSPDEIIQGLYLGDWRCASNKISLQDKNIKNVLNITKNHPNLFESEYNYLHYIAEDSPTENFYDVMKGGSEFINNCQEEKKENILVHCEAGISRSATVVMAFLIKHKNYNLKNAYFYTKSKRNKISPNYGFIRLLLKWEQEILGSNSCTFEWGLLQFLGEIIPCITEENIKKALTEANDDVETMVMKMMSEQFD